MATKKRKSTGLVQCKKSHNHLVCWIPLGNKKRLTVFELWFVPKKQNNHRPYLVRLRGLLLATIVLVGIHSLHSFITTGSPKILGYATDISSQNVTSDINRARTDNNVQPLQENSILNEAARLKANDMLQNDYWAHNSPDGVQPWRWFQEAGYAYQHAGENLAKDFRSSGSVTDAWLHSSSHRENMLAKKYTEVGIAVVNGTLGGEQTTLVVALFGTPRQTTSDAAPATITTTAAATSGTNIFKNPAQIRVLAHPISILTLTVLLLIFVVSLLTHWHYIKLPKKVRKSWYKHHSFYTACISLLTLGYITFILTAGTI